MTNVAPALLRRALPFMLLVVACVLLYIGFLELSTVQPNATSAAYVAGIGTQQSNSSALLAVVTTLMGGLIGYGSSRAMRVEGVKDRRRNVAQAFAIEIERLAVHFERWTTMFKNTAAGTSPAHKEIQKAVIRVDQVFYDSSGLYHALKQEIAIFDAELSRSLYKFYVDLLELERFRTYSNPTLGLEVQMLTQVPTLIARQHKSVAPILTLLRAEIARSTS